VRKNVGREVLKGDGPYWIVFGNANLSVRVSGATIGSQQKQRVAILRSLPMEPANYAVE